MRGKFSLTVFQIVKAIFSFLRHGWQVRFSNPSNAVYPSATWGTRETYNPLNSSLKLEASHQQYYFSSGGSCPIKKGEPDLSGMFGLPPGGFGGAAPQDFLAVLY